MKKKSLLLEGRTKELNEDHFRSLFNANCRQFKPQKILYRGISRYFEYGVIDPKNAGAIYTEDDSYYSFLVDNYWDNYPNRDKSVICTASRAVSKNYGDNSYIVIPFDRATFGVTPSSDFWNGFRYLSKEIGVTDMLQFDRMLGDLVGKRKLNKHKFFEMMKKISPLIDNKEKLADMLEKIKGKNFSYEKFLKYMYEHKKPFRDALEELFDPKKNGFRVGKYASLPLSLFRTDYEFWTDSKCLLIHENVFSKFMNIELSEMEQQDIARRQNANNIIGKRRLEDFKKLEPTDPQILNKIKLLERRFGR